MTIKNPELTSDEQEKLVFVVSAFAHCLTQEEQIALAASIERFSIMVATRLYTLAENEGMKKAYQGEETSSSHMGEQTHSTD